MEQQYCGARYSTCLPLTLDVEYPSSGLAVSGPCTLHSKSIVCCTACPVTLAVWKRGSSPREIAFARMSLLLSPSRVCMPTMVRIVELHLRTDMGAQLAFSISSQIPLSSCRDSYFHSSTSCRPHRVRLVDRLGLLDPLRSPVCCYCCCCCCSCFGIACKGHRYVLVEHGRFSCLCWQRRGASEIPRYFMIVSRFPV